MAQQMADNLVRAHQQLVDRFITGSFTAATAAAAGAGPAAGFENIVGVGIGEKVSGGSYTGIQCVKVYVVEKRSPQSVQREALAPAQVAGVVTDVEQVGELAALRHVGRMRPAPAGISVGHPAVTAGTIGAKVYLGRNAFILSNNHVLANSNNARRGDPILQPGFADGGRLPADQIGVLQRFIPLDFTGAPNDVDAALAGVNPNDVLDDILNIGAFDRRRIAQPSRLQVVMKTGRTTQTTLGLVIDTNFVGRVGYGNAGSALFRNQIVVVGVRGGSFSQGGDSGSLVIDTRTRRPVGLLFAGSPSHTLVNPIATVLRALRVHF